jgi:Ser/Thr protein kinase RdoA (MazF antagonist)
MIEGRWSAQALTDGCREVGLDDAGASLIRVGTNAVYRLDGTAVVARVAPADADDGEVARQVAVSRWLAGHGVAVVRPLDVEQPVKAAGHLVTFWEAVDGPDPDTVDRSTAAADLGQILARVHALPAPREIDLPVARPFRMRSYVDQLDHLDEADRLFMAERSDQLQEAFAQLQFELPTGPIHGDADVWNLLYDADGRAVLSDLDNVRLGPREWDLVPTARYVDRYGWHTEAEYRAFVTAYGGFDVLGWAGYPVLADIQELSSVVWTAELARSSQKAAEELGWRVHSLRTGEGREAWQPL